MEANQVIILIDEPRKSWKNHSHMVSNDIGQLHMFAESIGLSRHKYSNKNGKNQPHYDVPKSMFDLAVQSGAKVVPSKEIINFLRDYYE